jgi:hypothetical protein
MKQAQWKNAQTTRIAISFLQSLMQLVGVFEAINWAGLFLLRSCFFSETVTWGTKWCILPGSGDALRLSACRLITQPSLRNDFLCPKWQ